MVLTSLMPVGTMYILNMSQKRGEPMSLDVAYSLDIDDYIDPDRAYDLFWSGIILDKHNFICPGSNCYAKVTCANLDVERQNMKVTPHYRKFGTHSAECEVDKNKPLKLFYEDGSIATEESTLGISVSEKFILERPDSYYDGEKTGGAATKSKIKKVNKGKGKPSFVGERGHIGSIYSVRTMVSRYIKYKKDKTLRFRRINIKGKDVLYQELFKCVWEQDLGSLPQHPVVYYGWAYVDRLKSDDGYRIKFKKNLMYGEKELMATILISDRLIDGYKIKRLVSTRLEKISVLDRPSAYVFVYSNPKINKSKIGIEYANFKIDNLDFIDINYECPFPKEYDK